jgi:predicted RNA-binding protein with PUA-like domain
MIKKILTFFSHFRRSQVGVCSICDKTFPDHNLREKHDLFLCPQDYDDYPNYNWISVASALSDPTDPSQALLMQEQKEQLKNKGKKSFIKVSYSEKEGVIYTSFELFVGQV